MIKKLNNFLASKEVTKNINTQVAGFYSTLKEIKNQIILF